MCCTKNKFENSHESNLDFLDYCYFCTCIAYKYEPLKFWLLVSPNTYCHKLNCFHIIFLFFDEPHWIYFFYSDRSRIHKTINQHKKSEETSPCLLRSSTCVYTRWKLFDSGYLMSTNHSDLPWGGLGVCVSHMGKLLRFGLKKKTYDKIWFFQKLWM